MVFNERDKVRRCVTSKRRFGEVRIGTNEIMRRAVKIREIASPAAGNKNFLARAFTALQDRDSSPTFAGFDAAHQARSSSTDDQSIKFVNCFLRQEPTQFRGLTLPPHAEAGMLQGKLIAGED